ncbi:peptidoglycan-binding domain-containing protein [Streptomyces sp. NPDC094049]|uniref:peptidoglycan-binding domain-containing protein n=1 Tax=Streptomyces sp. NPDC094049 TaxID=3154987 RepID=UPI003321E4ED
MRNRAAPTTAVTSVGQETAPPEPPPGDHVFGQLAGPGHDGAGARGQDVELFDATLRLPPVPAHDPAVGDPVAHSAPRRSRHARTASPARRSMALPLALAGALSAGLGMALSVWLSPEHSPTTAPTTPLALPDAVPPAATDHAPDADTSAGPTTPPARTAATPAAPSRTTAPTPPATTAPPKDPAPVAPATAAPATTPPAFGPGTTRPPSSQRPDQDGPSSPRDLMVGSTGSDVTELQVRLQELYLYLGSADGVFSQDVAQALGRFQLARNLPDAPGVYGSATRAALRVETSGRR